MSGDQTEPSADKLMAIYAAGALTAEERAALEARLASGDEELRVALEAWSEVIVALGSAAPPIEPRPEIRAMLLARISGDGSPGPRGRPEPGTPGPPKLGGPPELGGPGPGGRLGDATSTPVPPRPADAPSGKPRRRARRGPTEQSSTEHPPAPAEETGLLVVKRAGEGEWKQMGPGAWARTLFLDARERRATMLVRLAAGASYAGHFHAGVEECLVLEGDLRVGDYVLRPGDYQRAPAGSWHGVQSSQEGCLCLVFVSL